MESVGTAMSGTGQTLASVFSNRVRENPGATAYMAFDAATGWTTVTWVAMAELAARIQAALAAEGLVSGDRIGIMARNGPLWVAFDVAAQGLGLITVPLFPEDRSDNIAWICADAGIKLLLVPGKLQLRRLLAVQDGLPTVGRIVCIETEVGEGVDHRVRALDGWLPRNGGEYLVREVDPDRPATISYTSGTTGRPKGVVLTHRAIVANALGAAACADFGPRDLFLSFLPLSHMLERTAGLYLPMLAGAQVAYARSINQLADDLVTLQPTALISVPRIYERVHGRLRDKLEAGSSLGRALFEWTVSVGWSRFEYHQGRAGWRPSMLAWPLLDRLVARKVRARLGGRLRYAVCGGAALAPEIARVFIGLGVPVYHGYGLTEASPVVSANRPECNLPASVGPPLPGVEVRIGEGGEVLVRGESVMLGYWNNESATREAIDGEGFLHTGDLGRIDEAGYLHLVGRIKEIIVLSNGEKVPPVDIEAAIGFDPLFEQVMVVGEGRASLAALVYPDQEHLAALAQEVGLEAEDAGTTDRRLEKAMLTRIAARLAAFPGYAKVRRVFITPEPWTVENGLLTPTMKIRRTRILDRFRDEVEMLYAHL